jgi:LysM repeat protein
MRSQILFPLITLALLGAPSAASADFGHVVAPGESLSSVAATDGLSVAQLAAANGLSLNAQLTSGSTIQIPPQTAGVTPSASVASAPAGPTSGGGSYVVRPGDTLSGIAAANGLTVDQLAAMNGLSPTGTLLAGSTVNLSGSGSSAASAAAGSTSAPSGGGYVVRPGDTLSGIAAANGLTVDQLAAINGLNPAGILLAGSTVNLSGSGSGSSAASAPAAPTGGGYVVQPGETLSGIAAAHGLSVSQLAAENGLNPAGILLAGATLSLPGSSAGSTLGAQPETTGVPGTGAQPTPGFVSPQQIADIAAANDVPPSLAEAIGYQESGFNNDLVSSTGATGVMQIEPATWRYIGRTLSPGVPLSPDSAQDNVRGGVLLLHSLLAQTGGDTSLAAAGYYQGLRSVLGHGMYSSTRRYVASVNALQQRFGGP